MSSSINIYASIDQLSREAALYTVNVAREAISERGIFTFALSGGTTPGKLFSLLVTDEFKNQINWRKTHFFWSDERCVPSDDPQSNYHLAWETLLSKLELNPIQIHRMPADQPDQEQAARIHEEEIRAFVAVDRGVPAFDLIQLGMGPEAHTASLFPHQPILHEQTRLILPVNVPKPPPERLTFTPPLLTHARHLLFLATGADKAEALYEVLYGVDNPDEYPTQGIVRQSIGEISWKLDQSIAQKFPEKA